MSETERRDRLVSICTGLPPVALDDHGDTRKNFRRYL
jgi:hypothetical protein